ncbi:MAG: choice-of-anchor D domain-containing protein [Calditrichaceae bacterium]|nr:choice-of-anchor D domain-containing protein [Calditrichia bacterium]NUQ41462.1 choice-of-anchor D domain-containing protein [Calditrichaceae bacterium]
MDAPSISAYPDPLVFDTTAVNQQSSETLYVLNQGNADLVVSDIVSTHPSFSASPAQFSVLPGDSEAVTVTFAPAAAGPHTGSLAILSNDPITPEYNVSVQGQGIDPPVIAVDPEMINVSLAPGYSTDVPVTISNTAPAGAANLDWSAEVFLTRVKLRVNPYSGPVSNEAEAHHPRAVEGHTYSLVAEAFWDLQYSCNLENLTGALGNAGAEFDGVYGYTTRWASNLLHKLDVYTCTLVEEFSIPGVTGLRDLAYDGAYMYGGAAANTIYQMDFTTKTLIGAIPSPVAVRHIAYDEGADAFWVGTWDTPPTLVSRTGQVLATLNTGLTAQYGSAYDKWNIGGPYLWVFDQGSGAGAPQLFHQYDLNTGTATGLSYDVASDFPASAGIAGGLWISVDIVPGRISLGGVLQGTPDIYFVYEESDGPVWMRLIGDDSGSIAPGDADGFIIRLFAMGTGLYQGSVVISSNDPATPVFTIPVTLDVITGLGEEDELPTTFDISWNYPNPFNPGTTLDFRLPQVANVKLEIYNVLGQKVRTLVDAQMQPGRYKAIWDGRNDAGAALSSGMYICRFAAGDFERVQKMILLK